MIELHDIYIKKWLDIIYFNLTDRLAADRLGVLNFAGKIMLFLSLNSETCRAVMK